MAIDPNNSKPLPPNCCSLTIAQAAVPVSGINDGSLASNFKYVPAGVTKGPLAGGDGCQAAAADAAGGSVSWDDQEHGTKAVCGKVVGLRIPIGPEESSLHQFAEICNANWWRNGGYPTIKQLFDLPGVLNT